MSEPVRISFDLDREVDDRINDTIPWGQKKHVFIAMSSLLADALSKYGINVITLLNEDLLELRPKEKRDG